MSHPDASAIESTSREPRGLPARITRWPRIRKSPARTLPRTRLVKLTTTLSTRPSPSASRVYAAASRGAGAAAAPGARARVARAAASAAARDVVERAGMDVGLSIYRQMAREEDFRGPWLRRTSL